MRNFLIVFPVAVLLLISVSFLGCSNEEEAPTQVATGPCSIELTTPVAGERFLPGAVDSQTVKIRWDKENGSDMVNIDLLNGGVEVARIAAGVANRGYYSWRAENNGEADGTDFSVRVSSDGNSDCASESEPFVLRNTIGCAVVFTNAWPDSMQAGDVITLTWENTLTPGLVEIALNLRDQNRQVIATDLLADGTYEWTVETFGLGSAERYSLHIRDTLIPAYCFSEGDDFEIAEQP